MSKKNNVAQNAQSLNPLNQVLVSYDTLRTQADIYLPES